MNYLHHQTFQYLTNGETIYIDYASDILQMSKVNSISPKIISTTNPENIHSQKSSLYIYKWIIDEYASIHITLTKIYNILYMRMRISHLK